jgi:hypothetical protein
MINLTALLEARTDSYVKGNRGRFILADEYIVLPNDSLWDWLDSIGSMMFHLLARAEGTGAFHNMPSVQKRVQNSRFSGRIKNKGAPMSVKARGRFGTYCPHRVNAKRDDGFRSWLCHNVVAVRIGKVDYVPASVDRWLNGGIFPW